MHSSKSWENHDTDWRNISQELAFSSLCLLTAVVGPSKNASFPDLSGAKPPTILSVPELAQEKKRGGPDTSSKIKNRAEIPPLFWARLPFFLLGASELQESSSELEESSKSVPTEL